MDSGVEGGEDAAEGGGMVLWVAAVFLQAFFLNRLMWVVVANGSPYSAFHGAIGLKLPSMAILPWV